MRKGRQQIHVVMPNSNLYCVLYTSLQSPSQSSILRISAYAHWMHGYRHMHSRRFEKVFSRQPLCASLVKHQKAPDLMPLFALPNNTKKPLRWLANQRIRLKCLFTFFQSTHRQNFLLSVPLVFNLSPQRHFKQSQFLDILSRSILQIYSTNLHFNTNQWKWPERKTE